MGDPVTIGLIVASTAASAKASLDAGKAQQNAANFNAEVSERNAKAAEEQADVIKRNSELDIQKFSKDFGRLQASTQQAFRYNGFVATGGTPLKVARENAMEADQEIATRRYNAEVGQREQRESAVESRMQASLSRVTGDQARKASYYQAAGSLLGGASKARKVQLES